MTSNIGLPAYISNEGQYKWADFGEITTFDKYSAYFSMFPRILTTSKMQKLMISAGDMLGSIKCRPTEMR